MRGEEIDRREREREREGEGEERGVNLNSLGEGGWGDRHRRHR